MSVYPNFATLWSGGSILSLPCLDRSPTVTFPCAVLLAASATSAQDCCFTMKLIAAAVRHWNLSVPSADAHQCQVHYIQQLTPQSAPSIGLPFAIVWLAHYVPHIPAR